VSLRGRVAIVTGSSRGIGAAIARGLAREGARVVVAAKSVRDRDRLPGTIHSVAAEIAAAGGEAVAIPCDVRDRGQVRDLVGRTVERFGRLDILVCNAGALWWRPLLATPEKRYDLVMQVNLEGALFACQAAIPRMREQRWGHLVTISPPIDLDLLPGRIAYLISKYGMTMLALGLAGELREDHIAANALWPVTLIESQASIHWRMGDPSMWRKPEIVADAVTALVGHDPSEITGRALLDEPFLRSLGRTDFERYSVVPGSVVPPLAELWGRLLGPDA
jgi:citronellol/citronellal dehydrogenase